MSRISRGSAVFEAFFRREHRLPRLRAARHLAREPADHAGQRSGARLVRFEDDCVVRGHRHRRLHRVYRARIGHGASDCRSSHSQEPQFCYRKCPDVADWRASLRHNRDSASVHAEFIALHRARGWYGYDPIRYRCVHGDDHCRSHRGAHQQPCSDHH